jgi:hypothetical protein
LQPVICIAIAVVQIDGTVVVVVGPGTVVVVEVEPLEHTPLLQLPPIKLQQ